MPYTFSVFIERLRTNTSGNVMAMVALSMIPLTGAIGAAVDLTRAYMARMRLQQACDAAVLAGRQTFISAAAGSTPSAKTLSETRKYFKANWADGSFQAPTFTVTPVIEVAHQLKLTISTTIPTHIMQIFGRSTLPINATCVAREDYTNIDIMLVLDTTGSMNSAPGSTGAPTTEATGSKMQATRDGVLALYDTLLPIEVDFASAAAASRKRIRYGIVPFAMMANVGDIVRTKNTMYVQTSSPYRLSGGTAPTVTHNTAWFTGTWDGCLEARATVNTITSASALTVPTGANDLDTNLIPVSGTPATQWPPADPTAQTAGTNNWLHYACPKQARPLAQVTARSELVTYLANANNAQPAALGIGTRSTAFKGGGYTYLDVGMKWGMTLISPTGIMASDNPTVHNTFRVTRHIIFMTDGALLTDSANYSSYGHEPLDRRITTNGNNATNQANHLRRFSILCNKAKAEGNFVWIIAFDTAMSTELSNCASGPGYTATASTGAELTTVFQQIAASIGSLRLHQ